MNDGSIIKYYLVFECDIETFVGVVNDDDVDNNEDNYEHKDLHEVGVEPHLCSMLQIDLLTSHLPWGKIIHYFILFLLRFVIIAIIIFYELSPFNCALEKYKSLD